MRALAEGRERVSPLRGRSLGWQSEIGYPEPDDGHALTDFPSRGAARLRLFAPPHPLYGRKGRNPRVPWYMTARYRSPTSENPIQTETGFRAPDGDGGPSSWTPARALLGVTLMGQLLPHQTHHQVIEILNAVAAHMHAARVARLATARRRCLVGEEDETALGELHQLAEDVLALIVEALAAMGLILTLISWA